MKKIADLTIFNQSNRKSGSYGHAARVGIEDLMIFNQSKGKIGSYASSSDNHNQDEADRLRS
jgi:hypothetical protein